MVVLRELTDKDEAAFFAGMAEWSEADRSWHTFAWKPEMSYSEMLERLRKERLGIELDPGRVRHSMLYGFVGDVIVGRVSVRHELNEALRRRRGHIGYAVAAKFRRRGYGDAMFTQGLQYCRSIGLREIMITCGCNNVGSVRMIEKAGARLADSIFDEVDKEEINRYWLKL